jgi:hypothetical protein
VVDPLADEKVSVLLAQHPELRSACEISTAAAHTELADTQVTITYVCIGDEVQALMTGLTVHAALADARSPVVVRARTGEGLPTLLSTAGGGFGGLRGFAVLDETCDASLLFGGFNESLAQLLHARYVAARESQGWTYGEQRDATRQTHPALTSWPELGAVHKEANRDQAADLWTKLAAVDCELAELTDWEAAHFSFSGEEVEELAEREHERWMRYQRRAGSGHGLSGRKEHPDLVAWRDLSEHEKEIDREFVRALPQLVAQLGYQVTRKHPREPS